MAPTNRSTSRQARRVQAVSAAALMLLLTVEVAAAAPKEVPKDVIAVQVRKQGFPCQKAEMAERDKTASKPDETVWTLTCEGATYQVRLVPKMAAQVKKLPPPDAPAATPPQPAPKAP